MHPLSAFMATTLFLTICILAALSLPNTVWWGTPPCLALTVVCMVWLMATAGDVRKFFALVLLSFFMSFGLAQTIHEQISAHSQHKEVIYGKAQQEEAPGRSGDR